jgi:predicted RNA-binding Zn ribbon-like protein
VNFDGYALDAVLLVGTTPDAHHTDDPLASLEGLRAFLAARPWLMDRARESDLAPLRRLRARLRAVFEAAAAGEQPDMVARLNELLARHRLSPSISGHDASDWHLHVAAGDGPLADDYAAGSAMGLTMAFLDLGPERFGSCVAEGCSGVFLDTSRNRSRRYCSDRCATRENVAALRSRRRGAAG